MAWFDEVVESKQPSTADSTPPSNNSEKRPAGLINSAVDKATKLPGRRAWFDLPDAHRSDD